MMDQFPVTCYKVECFQNLCGINCRLLHTPIHGKPCPFFKTDKQAREDRQKTMERLEAIDRYDLIDKYIYSNKVRY